MEAETVHHRRAKPRTPNASNKGRQTLGILRMFATFSMKMKAQPVSSHKRKASEDQRAPRPVEPEVLANDGDVLARAAHDVPVHLAPKASALEFADIRVDGPARKHAV